MKSQNSGFKIGSIVVFLGLTIYYLFPTIQWQLEQRHMASMVPSERVQYQEENAAKLQQLREESLSLGLDLQGGMYVTLEVGTPQLLLELAGEYADEELQDIIQTSRDRAFEQRTDFIDEFVTEFESRNPDGLLSRYYRSDADNITRRSSNEEITTYLR